MGTIKQTKTKNEGSQKRSEDIEELKRLIFFTNDQSNKDRFTNKELAQVVRKMFYVMSNTRSVVEKTLKEVMEYFGNTIKQVDEHLKMLYVTTNAMEKVLLEKGMITEADLKKQVEESLKGLSPTTPEESSESEEEHTLDQPPTQDK